SARELHRMRGVEYHGTTGLAHDREGAHVRNQVVVAERGAAFAHEDVVFSARLARLFHHVLHFGRRQELALLDVDRSSRCGDDVYEIGLAGRPDRKSTRLNSSHDQISYAVFCLKKKTKKQERQLQVID